MFPSIMNVDRNLSIVLGAPVTLSSMKQILLYHIRVSAEMLFLLITYLKIMIGICPILLFSGLINKHIHDYITNAFV